MQSADVIPLVYLPSITSKLTGGFIEGAHKAAQRPSRTAYISHKAKYTGRLDRPTFKSRAVYTPLTGVTKVAHHRVSQHSGTELLDRLSATVLSTAGV